MRMTHVSSVRTKSSYIARSPNTMIVQDHDPETLLQRGYAGCLVPFVRIDILGFDADFAEITVHLRASMIGG